MRSKNTFITDTLFHYQCYESMTLPIICPCSVANTIRILYVTNDFSVCLFVCLFGVDWGAGKSCRLEIWHVYVKWANLEQVLRFKRYLHQFLRKVTKGAETWFNARVKSIIMISTMICKLHVFSIFQKYTALQVSDTWFNSISLWMLLVRERVQQSLRAIWSSFRDLDRSGVESVE